MEVGTHESDYRSIGIAIADTFDTKVSVSVITLSAVLLSINTMLLIVSLTTLFIGHSSEF